MAKGLTFFAKRHSAELKTHNTALDILELFPIYKFCFHSKLKGHFIIEFCGITLLVTVKQKN